MFPPTHRCPATNCEARAGAASHTHNNAALNPIVSSAMALFVGNTRGLKKSVMRLVFVARNQVVKRRGHRMRKLPWNGEGENDELGKVVG